MEIAGKVCMVTGAGSGLGYATCKQLANAGATVIATDFREDSLKRFMDDDPSVIVPVVLDVSDERSVKDGVDLILDRFGALDIAVNCAGVGDAEKTLSKDGVSTLSIWNKVIGVNLTGTYNVLRFSSLAMTSNSPAHSTGERGVIINVASVAAWQAQAGHVAYGASKAGVVGITLPAARDLAPFGIRVVAIAPGMFETAMVAGVPDHIAAITERMVLYPQRRGHPQEFASLVQHVVENSYINASTISIDAGVRISAH